MTAAIERIAIIFYMPESLLFLFFSSDCIYEGSLLLKRSITSKIKKLKYPQILKNRIISLFGCFPHHQYIFSIAASLILLYVRLKVKLTLSPDNVININLLIQQRMDLSLMTTSEKIEKLLYCLLIIISSVELAVGAQYAAVMKEWSVLSTAFYDDYYLTSDQAYYLFVGIFSLVMLLFLFYHSAVKPRQPWRIQIAFYGTLLMACLQIGVSIFSAFTLTLDKQTGFAALIDDLPDSVQRSSAITLEAELTAQTCLGFIIGLPSLIYLMYLRHFEWTQGYFKVKLSGEGSSAGASSYARLT